jgi:hypothetical protein
MKFGTYLCRGAMKSSQNCKFKKKKILCFFQKWHERWGLNIMRFEVWKAMSTRYGPGIDTLKKGGGNFIIFFSLLASTYLLHIMHLHHREKEEEEEKEKDQNIHRSVYIQKRKRK